MHISVNNNSKIYQGDCREKLDIFEPETFQAIIADPPYFQVLLGEDWDNQWQIINKDWLN
jgi:DNA modification methylase